MAKKPKKPDVEYIDIYQMELDQKLPNWLNPIEKYKHKFDAKRKQNQIKHSNEIQAEAKAKAKKRKG